jgi:hypothetical protein
MVEFNLIWCVPASTVLAAIAGAASAAAASVSTIVMLRLVTPRLAEHLKL